MVRQWKILTPFSEENRNADARAFALTKHLQETDAREQTVVMIQVENESRHDPGCTGSQSAGE